MSLAPGMTPDQVFAMDALLSARLIVAASRTRLRAADATPSHADKITRGRGETTHEIHSLDGLLGILRKSGAEKTA